jgi:hypothetical protein
MPAYRTRVRRRPTSACAVGLILGSAGFLATANAQPAGGAQPVPAPVPVPAPQPAPQPQPEPERVDPVPDTSPPPAAAPEVEPVEVEPEEGGVTAWFRVDADSLGTQFWAGGSHPLGPIGLAANGIMRGAIGEMDIGLDLRAGDLRVVPVVGMSFDFANENAVGITAPRVITSFDGGPIYFESWLQLTFESPFEKTAADLFYTRDFLLYRVADWIALGPELELTYQLNHEKQLLSLPIGGHVELRHGEDNRLSFFLGYDTDELPNSDGLAGRVTLVHDW